MREVFFLGCAILIPSGTIFDKNTILNLAYKSKSYRSKIVAVERSCLRRGNFLGHLNEFSEISFLYLGLKTDGKQR